MKGKTRAATWISGCVLLICLAAPAAQAESGVCSNAEFRYGPAAELPDCRAYEMVSPLDKNGGDIRALPPAISDIYGSHKQSSLDGRRITYTSATAFGDAPSGLWSNQYMSSRTDSGWQTHGISQPLDTALFELKGTLPVPNWDTETLFEAFTPDLCSAWVKDVNVEPLTSDGLPGYVNLYRRSNCGSEGYEALTTQPPGPATPYFNGAGEWGFELEPTGPGLRFQGASIDLRHQVFLSGAPLLPEEVGSDLVCTTTTSAPTIGYQWLRNGIAIEGATAAVYTITSADAGAAIQCQVFAFNASAGSTQAATKARVVSPAPGTPLPVAPATISEPARSAPLTVGGPGGQTLTCDPQADEWTGSPTFSYQWYRNGVAIVGATSSTYTVTSADLATRAVFQCAVFGTNPGGTVVKMSFHRPTSPAPSPSAPCNGGQPFCAVNASLNRTHLYDLHEGHLERVGVLPNGKPNPENSVAGTLGNPAVTRESMLDHAVSADGSRIFWTSKSGPFARGAGQIYVRVGGDETFSVSGAAEALSGTSQSLFWTADSDGGAVLFSTGNFNLKNLSESADLYEFDVDSKETRLIAKNSPGVLGASDDLTRIYFVSTDALAEGAVAGHWNLYLEDHQDIRLVTILSSADRDLHVVGLSAIRPAPTARVSRVTPDGQQIAFQAVGSLTGYDNVNSGKRFTEVFHYDAENNRLTCVSCNPTGPPSGTAIKTPYGAFDEPFVPASSFNEQFGQAATLPPWERDFYASRVLTDDGQRVYFHSHEALVSHDTNGGIQDVYQWEAQGTGGCERDGGCVDLISAGTSTEKAEFVDASADGDDVFFTTTSGVDPRDEGSVDLYDARVGGGFPIPPVGPKCVGDGCRPPTALPARPTPAGALFDASEGPAQRSCRVLATRAVRAIRRARRIQSPAAHRQARKVRGRLQRCRRLSREGS